MNIRDYLVPSSLEECLHLLNELEGRGRLVAGGTDLVSKLEQGKLSAEVLIDISRIRDLSGFEIQERGLVFGAATSHGQISSDIRIKKHWPALAKACNCVGSPQIRQVATVAGNVVNAQPAADAAVALVALGAYAEIISYEERRVESVEDLYKGLGQSKIDSCREMLARIILPIPAEGEVNTYGRVSPRNSLCLPIVNAAINLKTTDGRIEKARIAMGPVADRPFRPGKAESALEGAALDDSDAWETVARIAGEEANPRDSCIRGCSDYRRQLLKVLVRTLLEEVVSIARKSAVSQEVPRT